MTEAVVGTPSIVGFGVNGDEYHRGTRDLIQMGFRADGFRDVLEATRNEGRDILSNLAINGSAIERTSAAVGLNVEKVAAAINLNVEKTAAATSLAIERTAAAGILEAQKNAAAAALKACECCCEIKELIRADGQETRALINSNEMSRLRDALASSQQEVLIARLGGTTAAVARV